ncbi:hypothetical protein B0H14DRAFT_2658494, partial [Mycena olivaceomarginata]
MPPPHFQLRVGRLSDLPGPQFFTWQYNASRCCRIRPSTVHKTLFQCCAIRPMYAPVLFATTPQATGTGPAHARAALNPITEETGSPQNTLHLKTPAARVASHLLGRFDATTTSMASPGPRRGNRGHYSDDEDSPDSEDLPPIPPRLDVERIFDPDLEGEPARGRSAPLSSSEPMEGSERSTQHGPAMAATDRSHGHIIDADKFAWSTDDTLKNSKSPDASYFLERISRSFPSSGQGELGRVPFSNAELLKRLVKVIVSNDLSINLVENRDFRDLLLFLRETLRDEDVPHRTKIREAIIDAWILYYLDLQSQLQAALGKLCFTIDIWSSKGLSPYLAITVHWLAQTASKQLALQQALLAFRMMRGAHSGQRIARVVFNILDQANLLHKSLIVVSRSDILLWITPPTTKHLWNCLERLLAERAIIDFCAKNTIFAAFRTFVYQGNGSSDDTSTQYPDTDTDQRQKQTHTSDSAHSPRQKNPEIWPNLSRKKNSSIHSQIGSASRLIVGNNRGRKYNQPLDHSQRPKCSNFNNLVPVTVLPDKSPWKHLTGLDLSFWSSSEQPQAVQQVMSAAENTPVLAGALPAFELFVDSWKTMVKDTDLIKENVVQFIEPGLTIAKKYYNRFGDTDAYIIAM